MRKWVGLAALSCLMLLVMLWSVFGQQQRNRASAPRTPAQADLKLKYRSTVSGQSNESTTMIKGARERSEMSFGYGGSFVTITQCDLKRTIQLSELSKKYVISPMQSGTGSDTGPAAPPSSSVPTKRGGVVTYTTTATDTGERKEMYGFTARHIKSSIDIESSPDACHETKQRMEIDGWYIDLSVAWDCELGRAQAMSRPAMPGGCQDQTRFKRNGTVKTGYALSETTTMYGPNGSVSFTSTREVIELSRDALDPALFDIPAGYTEAQSTQELYGSPSTISGVSTPPTTSPQNDSTETAISADRKASGALRVGVVPLNNKTDKSVSTYTLRDRLIGQIQGAGIEAIALNAETQMAAEAEASSKQCDFILYTDITSLKSSKVGGMFGRVTGVTGAGKTDSRVDFKLFAVGESAPKLQSSATGKEDGEEASASLALDSAAKMVTAEVKKRGRG